MSLCEHCGEELDDFAPCSCGLDGRAPPKKQKKPSTMPAPFRGSMRHLVHEKLRRQGKVAK